MEPTTSMSPCQFHAGLLIAPLLPLRRCDGIELCVVAAGDDQQRIDALGQLTLIVAELLARLL